MGASHSNDDEDDQRPDDQSQGPKLEQKNNIQSVIIAFPK